MQRELCATVSNHQHSVTAERGEDGRWRVAIDGREQVVDAREVRPGTWSLLIDGASYVVDIDQRRAGTVALMGDTETPIKLEDARRKRLAEMARRDDALDEGSDVIAAPIAGKVVKLLANAGDRVKEGQPVMVLEAMKMENEIKAPRDAVIKVVHVEAGKSVETQEPLLTLE
jgi:biotin carboxyl carrier protein